MIIIDTNILLIPGTLGVDVLEELKEAINVKPDFAIVEGTLTELKKIITEQRAKYSSAAKLGLQLVKTNQLTVLDQESEVVDDELAKLSAQGHLIVTQDAELKSRLTKPYITLKGKSHFVVVK